jgi:hypothetical protein
MWKKFGRWWAGVGKSIGQGKRHIEEHWPRYLLSAVTATFTFQAAWILTAQLYYAFMAVILAEGMMLYWLSRLEVYENWIQGTVAGLMFLVGCVAIVTTDIASAQLIASNNDTFSFYTKVPEWVQWVVTNITPILASSNLISYGIFEFFSDTNRDKRYNAAKRREVDRIDKASQRDAQRLRSRGRILRRKQAVARIEKHHTRRFGKEMVNKVSILMGLETDSQMEERPPWWERFLPKKKEEEVKRGKNRRK